MPVLILWAVPAILVVGGGIVAARCRRSSQAHL